MEEMIRKIKEVTLQRVTNINKIVWRNSDKKKIEAKKERKHCSGFVLTHRLHLSREHAIKGDQVAATVVSRRRHKKSLN